jgi:hypothetical protein
METVKLNVGGRRFETLRSTLLSVPGTYFHGLLDCQPAEEYFIDRDGEKFAPILNYLRGARNEWIDPEEAGFYALPMPTNELHKRIQGDKEFAQAFLRKHEEAIISDAVSCYMDTAVTGRDETSMRRWLFPCLEWTPCTQVEIEKNPDKFIHLSEWRRDLLRTFQPDSHSYYALVREMHHFWRPYGLICTIVPGHNCIVPELSPVIVYSWKPE